MAENRERNEQNKRIWVIRIVLALVLTAALLLSLIWTDAINRKFGLVKVVEDEYQGNKTAEIIALGGDLNVHFVDVGQGDACVIELPDEKKMLIDAGDTKTENKQKLLSYIEENINDAAGNDITYFDYAVLTHPDSDHCGGMADVLNTYPAKEFYRPNVYSVYNDDKADDDWKDPCKASIVAAIHPADENDNANCKNTRAYDRALKAAHEGRVDDVPTTVHITDATDEQISVIEPEGIEEGEAGYYSLTFYAPIGAKSYKDNNNYSPVMILEYGGKRFMLSGDAEKDAEADFVAEAKKGEGKYAVFTDTFTVDVFKLGHHGSRTSSSEDFIKVMTTPANRPNVVAVVSCGEGNSYGHPHAEVLTRLRDLGFTDDNIVRTDVNGSIAMSVRGNAETGEYELLFGAETVRRTTAAVGNDDIHLTWQEIVILGILLIMVVLIITPAVQSVRKSMRKAARSAGKRSRR